MLILEQLAQHLLVERLVAGLLVLRNSFMAQFTRQEPAGQFQPRLEPRVHSQPVGWQQDSNLDHHLLASHSKLD